MSRVLKLVIVSVFSRKLYPPVELWIITGTWDVMKNWVEKDVLELSNHKVNLLAAIVKSLLKWIVSQTKHNATKILTEALGWICLNETLSGESIICAVLGKTPNLSLPDCAVWFILLGNTQSLLVMLPPFNTTTRVWAEGYYHHRDICQKTKKRIIVAAKCDFWGARTPVDILHTLSSN